MDNLCPNCGCLIVESCCLQCGYVDNSPLEGLTLLGSEDLVQSDDSDWDDDL